MEGIKNMKDFSACGKDSLIRVNVPGTSGFYRLRCEAFFTVSKGQFTKMIKALKADAGTAADNAKTLFDFAHYMRETYNTDYFKICPERIATIGEIWNPDFVEDTKEQKRINKNIMPFCADKKDGRPVLRKPFESNGILYATNAFIAVRIDNRNNYTGDFYGYQGSDFPNNCSAPNMSRLFLDNKTVMDTFTPVILPSVSVFETWTNKGKVFDRDGEINCIFQACGIGFNAAYIYKCLLLTDSNTLYINPVKNQPCYIIGNGFTCIVLPVYDTYKDYLPAVCMYQRGYNGETVIDLTDPEAVTIPSEKTRKPRKQNNGIKTAAENKKSAPAGKELANHAAGAIVSDTVNNNIIDSRDPKRLYKIAGVELEKNRIEDVINNNDYLVKSRTVYRIERTRRGYIAINVYQKKTGVPIIGGACRFTIMSRERLEKMFSDFADKEFKPVPAADPGNTETVISENVSDAGKLEKDPERMPERTTENAAAVMHAKTAVNDAETGRRYNYHGNAKHAGNGTETAGKQAAALYNLHTDKARIPALVKNTAIFTNTSCENIGIAHKYMHAKLPAGIHPDEISFCGFLRSSATFCDRKNYLCDISAGVPPGTPGMLVSSSWNHPCSA